MDFSYFFSAQTSIFAASLQEAFEELYNLLTFYPEFFVGYEGFYICFIPSTSLLFKYCCPPLLMLVILSYFINQYACCTQELQNR